MKKTSLIILLCVVAVISFVIGMSLSGNFNKNKTDDFGTTLTTDAVSTTVAEQNEPAPETTSTAAESTGTSANAITEQQAPSEVITPSEAKSIALKDAGFDTADVWDKEVELDYENGKWIYEVSFEKNGTDYEYIIDALTGEVLHSEVDPY